MKTTRRDFVGMTAGGLVGVALAVRRSVPVYGSSKLRLSACDWSLKVKDPGSFEVGKRIGLDGIEIAAGNPADKLKISDPGYREQCKENVKKTGVVVSSTAMSLFNKAPLATDPRGPDWLDQTIDATKDLDAKVILLAFFGRGALRDDDGLKMKDVDVVVERIKDAAPKAEDAGIILGLENTLSAKDNMTILEKIQHDSVKVYYDIGNSTRNGFDVPTEIRMLGDRICQFHFKDKDSPFLGRGEVKMVPVAKSIRDIGYEGWIVLETKVQKDRDADFKANANYTRRLMDMTTPGG